MLPSFSLFVRARDWLRTGPWDVECILTNAELELFLSSAIEQSGSESNATQVASQY